MIKILNKDSGLIKSYSSENYLIKKTPSTVDHLIVCGNCRHINHGSQITWYYITGLDLVTIKLHMDEYLHL